MASVNYDWALPYCMEGNVLGTSGCNNLIEPDYSSPSLNTASDDRGKSDLITQATAAYISLGGWGVAQSHPIAGKANIHR